ncbi:helix-turn-helix domain-containing protein [Qipengyuania sp. NPDC077410]|uniref:helix-turn-helix domain-containing protein n=1 Tax=Qipengyuania sp. NPDC077410 TaxID=3364496 RepID=UPI0037C9F7D0
MIQSNKGEASDAERLNPLAMTIEEAAHVARLSRSTIYLALRDGSLTARKVGRRTIIRVEDLRQFLAALPAFESQRVEGDV